MFNNESNKDELAYSSADYWCDLCGDGVKSSVINFNGERLEVCSHCEKLT